MSSTESPDRDLVDRLLAIVDRVLDTIHDRVIRPILLVGRFIAYGLILLLVSFFLVSMIIIGLIRVLNVYVFTGHEWLSYAVIGALFLLIGMLIWRRRRPVSLRK